MIYLPGKSIGRYVYPQIQIPLAKNNARTRISISE